MKSDSSTTMSRGRIGLALSGGGSRAIAFHLGCMRSLNKHNLLKDIKVISTVSGGSVIGAMYAYSNDSFEEFDNRVVDLLKEGLVSRALAKALRPKRILLLLTTFAFSILAHIVGLFRSITNRIRLSESLKTRLRNPLPFTQTDLIRLVLEEDIFQGQTLDSKTRDDIDIVINATELQTGTALRFGKVETSCWKFGVINSASIPLGFAVTSSAAFPLILPCLTRDFEFERLSDRVSQVQRCEVSDGGVYDNLGILVFSPHRRKPYSGNIFKVDSLIVSNASTGSNPEMQSPYHAVERALRVTTVIHQKAQDNSVGMLFSWLKDGSLRKMIMPYLGIKDESLGARCKNDVSREDVCRYPTNFSRMPESDIEKLTRRGEEVTDALIHEHSF